MNLAFTKNSHRKPFNRKFLERPFCYLPISVKEIKTLIFKKLLLSKSTQSIEMDNIT